MWYCPNCGKDNNDAFCSDCGTRRPEEFNEVTADFSADNNASAGFGTQPNYYEPTAQQTNNYYEPTAQQPSYEQPVQQQAYDPGAYSYTPQPQPPKKKSNAVLWIICIVLALVLAGAAAFGIYTYMDIQEGYSDSVDDDDEDNNEEEDEKDKDKDEKQDSKKLGNKKKNVNKIKNTKIEQIISDNSDYTTFGIYVKNLDNDYEYGYNDDEEFLASAMGQIVILNTVSSFIETDDIDIDEEEYYFSYLPNGKEAPDSKDEDGEYVTIKKYIEDVATYGDNNKSNHLIDYIAELDGSDNGFDVINDMLEDRDYDVTKVNRKTYTNEKYIDKSSLPNSTSPYEIGNLFEELINNGNIGSQRYMMNMFKSVGNDGKAIGLMKYIPSHFASCNANAFTSQVTNNVAVISDGKTEIVVALLATTDESKKTIETNDEREYVQSLILEYILETQFEE